MTFVPNTLLSIRVAGSYISAYPAIDNTMGPHEQAYAFHVNKMIFSNLTITLRQMLTALGHKIGQSTTVTGEMSDFIHCFNSMWCDFSQLTIISFHNSVRYLMNDMATIEEEQ